MKEITLCLLALTQTQFKRLQNEAQVKSRIDDERILNVKQAEWNMGNIPVYRSAVQAAVYMGFRDCLAVRVPRPIGEPTSASLRDIVLNRVKGTSDDNSDGVDVLYRVTTRCMIPSRPYRPFV